MMARMITASLSPNTEGDDVFNAIKTLFQPWAWKHGIDRLWIHNWFKTHYLATSVSSFSSGRMALTALFHSFGIGRGDEVLVQAFTCVAVPNSAVWAGATPVYVDVDDSLNIDTLDAQKKLTSKTKALIVQHTFGITANMDRIVKFCATHNLILIEDCAHSLGATFRKRLLGTFGDAAFFSFGRDKVLSSVWGGVAILHKGKKEQSMRLFQFEQSLPMPSLLWIATQIVHPIIFSLCLPFYRIGIGKAVIALLRLLQVITLPIYKEEYKGGKPKALCTQYPNALARLLRLQLLKIDRYASMRATSALAYKKTLFGHARAHMIPAPFQAQYLRFPLFVDDPVRIKKLARKEGILLGNWYSNILDPKGVSFASLGFVASSCPKAQYAAQHIVNLPTRLTPAETIRVCSFLSRNV